MCVCGGGGCYTAGDDSIKSSPLFFLANIPQQGSTSCSRFTKGVFQTVLVLWLSWLHQAAGEAGKWEEADSGLGRGEPLA